MMESDSPSNLTRSKKNDDTSSSSGKRIHTVWEYFTFEPATKRHKCNSADCTTTIAGAWTTNVLQHLAWKHPTVYPAVLEREENIKKEDKEKTNTSKYDPSHQRQQQFTRDFALWVSTNATIPINVAEHEEFKNMIVNINSSLRVPCRQTLNTKMNELRIEVEAKIKALILRNNKIAISADIWTKKGLTSSFLGVLATLYDDQTKSKFNLLLDVICITSITHKAPDILREFDAVIKKYDIPLEKIWFVVSDSGSNMISAFKNLELLVQETDRDEDEDVIIDSDSEEDSDRAQVPRRLQYNHYACLIHSLLLCLKPFYLVPSFDRVVQKIRKIATLFNHSMTMTAILKEKSKVKLMQFSTARWNIVYIFVERFLAVRVFLNDVLHSGGHEEHELTDEDWTELDVIATFLKPFYNHTTMAQGEDTIYFSEATLILKDLEEHLNTFQAEVIGLEAVKTSILSEIKKRFNRYYSEKNETSLSIGISNRTLPLYLAATLLDPRYRHVLDSRERQIAVDCIKSLVTTSSDKVRDDLPKSPLKTSRYAYVASKYSRISQDLGTSKDIGFGAEIEKYLGTCSFERGSQAPPLRFWEDNKKNFPSLSTLALNLLCLPMNTGPLERTFSLGGIATAGRRNILDKANLSREIFMSRNKNLLI